MPTLADIGNGKVDSNIDGKSFAASLVGSEQEAHEYLYWEFPSYKGQQAVRWGDYKGIRKNMMGGNLEIELYDLKNDPGAK